MSETLFIIICLALTLSLGLNVFAIWYSKSLLSRLYYWWPLTPYKWYYRDTRGFRRNIYNVRRHRGRTF